jgi:hypothetical protein
LENFRFQVRIRPVARISFLRQRTNLDRHLNFLIVADSETSKNSAKPAISDLLAQLVFAALKVVAEVSKNGTYLQQRHFRWSFRSQY